MTLNNKQNNNNSLKYFLSFLIFITSLLFLIMTILMTIPSSTALQDLVEGVVTLSPS